jgi:hypothetical protein
LQRQQFYNDGVKSRHERISVTIQEQFLDSLYFPIQKIGYYIKKIISAPLPTYEKIW